VSIGNDMTLCMQEAVVRARSGNSFVFEFSAETVTGARNVGGQGDSPDGVDGSRSCPLAPMWAFTYTISNRSVEVAPIIQRISRLCVSIVTKRRRAGA
jgi:hypothetical protein